MFLLRTDYAKSVKTQDRIEDKRKFKIKPTWSKSTIKKKF